jgi:hypothetical protein
VIKALKILYTASLRRASLGILRQGLLAGGEMRATDLDHHLTFTVPGGPAPGLVDIALYIASGSIDAGLRASEGLSTDDFPGAPPLVEPVELSPDIYAGALPVAGAVAGDRSRERLCYVHFNHIRQRAEATDGRRLYIRDLAAVPPASFLLAPLTLRLLDALPPATVGLITDTHVYFAGDGWSLMAKLGEGPYPVVDRIIPTKDRTPPVEWTVPTYATLKKWLAAAKPFYNPRTTLVYFSNTEGCTRNPEINHPATATALGALFNLPGDDLIGLSATYLADTLAYIANRPATVTAGTDGISSVIWRGEGWMALQMPLRTRKTGVMTRADLFAGVAYDA